MSLTFDSFLNVQHLVVINGGSLLLLIASCLVADSPNKVEQGLLISAYWVLMISHAAPTGQVIYSNHHWTGRGLL